MKVRFNHDSKNNISRSKPAGKLGTKETDAIEFHILQAFLERLV